MDILV
ncbi:hypothetical protein BN1723_007986 [Verticillium longisporum]